MAEMKGWFACITYVHHKKERGSTLNDGILEGIRRTIDYLQEAKLLKKGLDAELEAEKLYALVDGLALHRMLQPDRISREQLIAVLTSCINSIFTEKERLSP